MSSTMRVFIFYVLLMAAHAATHGVKSNILELPELPGVPFGGPEYFQEYFRLLELQGRSGAENEDADMLVPDIIQKYGYTCEQHFITTEDGYILGIHRIPSGKNSTIIGRTPILVQHGLSSSSADWIIAGTEKAFAYILADAGYDVWLGNSRGNRYSRNHTTLNPDTDKDFWNFSFHAIGVNDTSAVVDYILANTGQSKLFYAGHSEGTTIFYVLNSMKPEYNDKFRAQFSLSPIGYMSNLVSQPFRDMAANIENIEFMSNAFGYYEYLPTGGAYNMAARETCNTTDPIAQDECMNSLFDTYGYDPAQFNYTLLIISMGHSPAGCSIYQLLHFLQEVNSGRFCQYDYGNAVQNNQHYGSDTPPDYDLGMVTAPVYLFYSDNDYMSSPIDVTKLSNELSNVKGLIKIEDPLWNHIDYMWGIDARKFVYQPVIDLMAVN